ncbi:MAG: sigma-70 family RNA polymerase sigma factor, partial [Opitutaceae bacterium]
MSDSDLLARYVRDRDQAAFAEIVQRHLDLVYSVARRHVHSPALAEDVAQTVFIQLARDAARIHPGTPLIAWLHVASRRRAINAGRDETRRAAREHAAVLLAE